ncbi:MAG: NAD-dependent deacylase [Chloroflexi bacterium]|nr:MAG: NAD-dependent deacylase [Chloroflexota bacterium]
MDAIPQDLIFILRKATRVAALTGAGVSQESGLRTFREAQTGLWTQYKPEDLASPEAFARNPKLVWDWYAMRRARVAEVQPNPGHFALAQLARRVPQFTLITQNVDGLHFRAEETLKVSETFRVCKSYPILELHGNITRVRCSECGAQAQTRADDGQDVPRCQLCGALLRPDVVWFGESLPREALTAAVEAARACDVFFSIGTSGIVQPAASLAHAARNRGAIVIEINFEPTSLTAKADFFLQGKSGEVLPDLVRAVWP